MVELDPFQAVAAVAYCLFVGGSVGYSWKGSEGQATRSRLFDAATEGLLLGALFSVVPAFGVMMVVIFIAELF